MRQHKTGEKTSVNQIKQCAHQTTLKMKPWIHMLLNDGTIFMEIHIFVWSVMHITYTGRERSYLSTDFRL